MDSAKRRALSEFYREEFRNHFEHLQANGILKDGNELMRQACRKLLADLDQVCWKSEFPAVAETLLQKFDTLTRLSELDPRQRH
ncbi:MAG TPA: hypothetical protein VGL15_12615 [Vicinamibacteria bacterium]